MDSDAQKELLEFLNNAIEIETDVATQEKIAAEYEKNMAERKPSLITQQEPKVPIFEYKTADGRSENDAHGWIALWAGLAIFLFIMAAGIASSGEGGLALPFVLCGVVFFIFAERIRRDLKKSKEDFSVMLEQFEKQRATVRKENSEKQKEYEANSCNWNCSYRESKAILEEHLNKTKDLLTKLYQKNMIYPKYCTLPALTSIYEYFVTGRCQELTGPDGAYNLYENEVRKDTVIAQLNSVIENLEKIRQNQYMLYQQVKAIQENTDAIAAELHQIKGYTVAITQLSALNTYYTALNERNNRIMMYYHL